MLQYKPSNGGGGVPSPDLLALLLAPLGKGSLEVRWCHANPQGQEVSRYQHIKYVTIQHSTAFTAQEIAASATSLAGCSRRR